MADSYSSGSLHAEYKGIGRHVSGIGERVFLPHLAERVLHGRHGGMVEGEVAWLLLVCWFDAGSDGIHLQRTDV